GQVVEREADRLGTPVAQRLLVVARREDLQVEQAHLVPRRLHRRGDALEPERLQTEIDLREHQRARVDEQHAHGDLRRRLGEPPVIPPPGRRQTSVRSRRAIYNGNVATSSRSRAPASRRTGAPSPTRIVSISSPVSASTLARSRGGSSMTFSRRRDSLPGGLPII